MKMRNAVSLNPKPGGSGSAKESRHQVDLLEIVAVDLAQLLPPRRVVGELVERLDRVLVQQPPELVVARHAALAVAQDVDRRQIEMLPVVTRQVLQMARVVVQRDGARMAGAERIEQVGHRQVLGDGRRLPP